MSTIIAACGCGSIGAPADTVRQCLEHHRYWRGDKELMSVTKVIKGTWPLKPDYSRAKPEVLENARDRGVVVDALFSAYINGTLDKIPAGTRTDAKDLFLKLMKWWDKNGEPARAQVILADGEIAGTCDILTRNRILDVKCTYNIEATYPLQLGAYADLYSETYLDIWESEGPPALGILHVTERFAEPKLIEFSSEEVEEDWRTLRDTWRMVKRRTS